MSLLATLQQEGALRALDLGLADTLRRLRPATPEAVLAAAALASLAVAQGHAGLELAAPQRLVEGARPWPKAEDWAQRLAASPWVAVPEASEAAAAAVPLVLEQGRLYLRRYREHERRLALALRRIAAQPMPEVDMAAIAPLFAGLFPEAAQGDHQARAAALALRHALLLVTGGPGTGKTTTIARLLALRVAQALQAGQAPPRIALAAPTGRAAERMADSLRRAVAQMAALGVEATVLAALPSSASTLHRLLGTLPDQPGFRHGADQPLPFDLVVVDEASMVDLPLMSRLAEAIAPGTQLLLLGDADQLPSVEAGDVLAAILAAAGAGDALTQADAQALQPLLGPASAAATATASGALRGHRVHLLRGWRQSEALELAPLAEAVRRGAGAEVLALLRGGGLSGVHFHEDGTDPLEADSGFDWLAHFRALATLSDPVEALRQVARCRLLTALRDGPQGARGLNARIEAQLSGRHGSAPPAWFAGRQILITRNSPRHGLFNGDVGLCLPDAAGTPLVWFPGSSAGEARPFHPAGLPEHDSAFAMTVHKAQGSEFDVVWLQLPRMDSRVLSRELVYTGLTRARHGLHVAASAPVLEAALSRHASRVSGLAWRLGVPAPA